MVSMAIRIHLNSKLFLLCDSFLIGILVIEYIACGNQLALVIKCSVVVFYLFGNEFLGTIFHNHSISILVLKFE